MRLFIFIFAVFIACFAGFGKNERALAAESTPRFILPLGCTLGKDCWAVNYLDVDPSADSHKDFKCGVKTYEAHKGVDFALRSRLEMAAGVNVLAGADGRVERVRDGESDMMKSEEAYKAIRAENKDCGNGILLRHGPGLETFYCRLKDGSLKVKPGDEVRAGDVIAQVGQSGYAEFPHLHFSVIWEGAHVDPFTGLTNQDGCGGFKRSLWKDEIAYEPYAVFDGGFEDKVPDFEVIKKGRMHPMHLSQTAQNIVYWAGFYHARAGDVIDLRITGPDGAVIAQTHKVLEQNRKRPSFYYTGRRLHGKALEPGTYKGEITYKREGFEAQTFSHSIVVR